VRFPQERAVLPRRHLTPRGMSLLPRRPDRSSGHLPAPGRGRESTRAISEPGTSVPTHIRTRGSVGDSRISGLTVQVWGMTSLTAILSVRAKANAR
jgi:hypothetical protein